jgi:predicted dehydrogenase
MNNQMHIAFVGCGYVADLYARALEVHPELKLAGVTDLDMDRARRFARHNNTNLYNSLDSLLADDSIQLVLNLTNPRSHYEVSRACLEAGKHVYSEKPLAMQFEQAQELVEAARNRGLMLSCAPCSLLSETAQSLWKAVRENQVGRVRVVFAELDDGLLHRMPYHLWLSETGTPWPYKDEMEVGNVLEHAGYYVSWLVAFFGPAVSVTAYGSVQVPDKLTAEPLDCEAPDFSVACIRFASGVSARLTCSIVAPHNHKLQIVGDDGIIETDDCWYYRRPVWIRRRLKIRRRVMLAPWRRRYRLVGNKDKLPVYKAASQMDWLRGVADMKQALDEARPHRISPEFSLHVCEVMLAIAAAGPEGRSTSIKTSFEPVEPMPWALD